MEQKETNTMTDKLEKIFEEQNKLQSHYGFVPAGMSDEEVIDYLRWNALALHAEVSEMTQEFGWKPWAKSQYINRDALVGEGVDVLKFLLNMLLAVGVTPAELFEKFTLKTAVNYERQRNGYTGLEKDANGRALDEPHRAA